MLSIVTTALCLTIRLQFAIEWLRRSNQQRGHFGAKFGQERVDRCKPNTKHNARTRQTDRPLNVITLIKTGKSACQRCRLTITITDIATVRLGHAPFTQTKYDVNDKKSRIVFLTFQQRYCVSCSVINMSDIYWIHASLTTEGSKARTLYKIYNT